MEKLDGKSFDLVGDNISKLKEIFPDVINGDNQIDFDNLRDILEKDIEVVDDNEEHYKFTWWGKKESKRVALESTTKTLRPYKKDSKNWDDTGNIYIEGDNLDALKILLGSYRDRIKMIYIDPPYNTGKDFVYHDNRTETIKEHLESTNQLNDDGQLLENPRTEGKYHSNWLNMMYPRLYLAKKLLTKEGIIFISIDDNEIENLKKICNEIFGENNFISQFYWKSRTSQNYSDKYISNIGEYILCYARDLNFTKEFGKDKSSPTNYTNPDNDPRGPWVSSGIIRDDGRRKYEVISPTGKKHYEAWLYTEDNFNKLNEEGRIWWGRDGNAKPRKKSYLKDWDGNPFTSLIVNKDITTEKGTNEVKNLFNARYFDYPKPTSLLLNLLEMNNEKECYVLDFFSGSASFGHAVMEYNSEHDTNINFILVQIPEETNKNSDAFDAGYKNICEIGKERIRLAGDKIVEESDNSDLDIGFKVFKIDESNFVPWNPKIKTTEDVKQEILGTANNIVRDRSELDLIYELLLQLNLDLNAKIEEKEVNNHKFYVVNNGFMLVCLDINIDESISKDIINIKEELMTEYCQVVLLDKALDSNSSINIFHDLDSEDIELYTI